MKPYISLPESVPGIRSLLMTYTQTGTHLESFAQQLLRGESSLTPGERELIAAYVSAGNDCKFCARSHAATAKYLLPVDQTEIINKVIQNDDQSGLTEKMKALLSIAESVRQDGLSVNQVQIDEARQAGADDQAIHDTVLIAAAFSMFNRYVDGLRTWTPDDTEMYENMGKRLAEYGYKSE